MSSVSLTIRTTHVLPFIHTNSANFVHFSGNCGITSSHAYSDNNDSKNMWRIKSFCNSITFIWIKLSIKEDCKSSTSAHSNLITKFQIFYVDEKIQIIVFLGFQFIKISKKHHMFVVIYVIEWKFMFEKIKVFIKIFFFYIIWCLLDKIIRIRLM